MIAHVARNVILTPKKRAGNVSHPSIDQNWNAEYPKRGLQPQGLGLNNPKPADSETNVTHENRTFLRKPQARKKSFEEINPLELAEQLATTARVTAVNTSISSWSFFIWFFVQLPFAILFLVMLGIAGIVEAALDSNFIFRAASGILATVSSVFGVTSGPVDMAKGYSLAVYIIIIALGFFSLLVAFFQYTLAFLNPLSGEQTGLKKGVFLLCLFGYAAPILNLFPWIYLWLAVVWKYPK